MFCPFFQMFLSCCEWVSISVLYRLISLLEFPDSFLVTMYRSFRSPFPAASSASFSMSSTYSLLYFLMFLLTFLCAAVYSSCAVALDVHVWIILSTRFLDFPFSNFCKMFANIHCFCCLPLFPKTSSYVSSHEPLVRLLWSSTPVFPPR